MKVILKTLSPIHIGTDNTIPPIEYYKTTDKHLIVFNQKRCIERIFEKHGENGTQEWVKWVDQYVKKFEEPKGSPGKQPNQVLAQFYKEFNLVNFCKNILKDEQLLNELIKEPQYWQYRCKFLATDLPVQLIREQLKTNQKPFIPGSSIKGALRTALAAYVIKHLSREEAEQLWLGDQNYRSLKRTIEEFDAKDAKKAAEAAEAAGKLIEEYVFRFGEKKFDRNQQREIIKYNDAKLDLLRFLHVSDAVPIQCQLAVGEMNSCSFKYNRKTNSRTFNKPPIDLAEVIDANSTLEFYLDFDPNCRETLRKLQNTGQYIEIETKVKRLLGFNLNDSGDVTKKVWERIQVALKEMAELIITREQDWLDEIKVNPAPTLRQFYQSLTMQSDLLHLGFAAGWHSTTICLALQANHYFAEQKAVEKIIRQFNLDLTQKDKRIMTKKESGLSEKERARRVQLLNRRISVADFPASRRLIATYRFNEPDTPLGWCQLTLS